MYGHMGWLMFGHLGWMTLATVLWIGVIAFLAWLAVIPLTRRLAAPPRRDTDRDTRA